jgi:hypothetical protein
MLTTACHAWGSHVGGVHSIGNAEEVCIQMDTTQTTLDAVRDKLVGVIDNEVLGWESRDNVNFLTAFVECEDAVDRDAYEIEFHVHDNDDWGPCPFYCYRPQSDVAHGNHRNVTKARIHFSANLISQPDGYQWTGYVNHEFGHGMGFGDPDNDPPDAVFQTAEGCLIRVKPVGRPRFIAPVWSVMHHNYCPRVPMDLTQWPTMFDFGTFENDIK